MTELSMDDASQGVVDTTEPVATPDTIAADTGRAAEAGQPATETPAAPATPDAPAAPKEKPWFVQRLERQKAELETARARLAELERGAHRQTPSAETGTPQTVNPADVDRLANERAEKIASDRAFNEDCNSIAAAGKSAHPDFMEAIGTLNMVAGITPALIEAVKEAGDPASLLYQLGKNPDEAARILALSPARMGAALAKLAAKAPTPPPVSRAPAPITPVAGAAKVDADPSSLSDDEWWRRQQAKAK